MVTSEQIFFSWHHLSMLTVYVIGETRQARLSLPGFVIAPKYFRHEIDIFAP